jgi:hypothetical protein
MLSSVLGVLPILIPPLCALALSCDQSPIPLLCLPLILYSFLYLKLAKTVCLSCYCLCFLFDISREEEGRTGSVWEGSGGVEVAQTIYTHVTKCKKDEIKVE